MGKNKHEEQDNSKGRLVVIVIAAIGIIYHVIRIIMR